MQKHENRVNLQHENKACLQLQNKVSLQPQNKVSLQRKIQPKGYAVATTHEKLASSLEALKKVQNGGVIRSSALGRTHRERLVQAGFLQKVVKGWLLQVDPARLEREGESTVWYGAFWGFVEQYLKHRFGDDYCLSAEASIWVHTENTMIPSQVIAVLDNPQSQALRLPHNTGLLIIKGKNPSSQKTQIRGLQCLSLGEALCRIPPVFFKTWPREAELALRMVNSPSILLDSLLDEGNTVVAGRLAGAYQFLGEEKTASEIIQSMESAGHTIRLTNPFEVNAPSLGSGTRVKAPLVGRLESMWAEMRSTVIANFPEPPGRTPNTKAYLDSVEERYVHDAYHSLSIEGYQVTTELIERVRKGVWQPEEYSQDKDQRNSMAAKGYYEAFKVVKEGIGKVLSGNDSALIAEQEHNEWYRALFSPSVQAGLLEARALAGYRRSPVYIRGSEHVPPRFESVVDGMEELFHLMKKEKHPAVRAVLGHFLFGFVHPYVDGNGRMSRFMMNLMLSQGGYPWTIINVKNRTRYMAALQRASSHRDIADFTALIVEEMQQEYTFSSRDS